MNNQDDLLELFRPLTAPLGRGMTAASQDNTGPALSSFLQYSETQSSQIVLPNNHPFGTSQRNNSLLIIKILRNAILSPTGSLPQNLILSCSGGVDSTALMVAVHKLQKYHNDKPSPIGNIKDVYVVHFHHGLRQDGSAELDEAFVKAMAKNFGYHYTPVYLNPDELRSDPNGTQSAAHDQRRSFLVDLSLSINNAPVLTAHHLDDQVEHLLYRLISGREIAPIPMLNPPYIRPFLGIEKRWLQQYCLYHKVTWREDPSNTSLDYDRNKIRNALLPVIHQLFPTFNPKKGILRLANLGAN